MHHTHADKLLNDFIAFSRVGMSDSMKYPPHNIKTWPCGKFSIEFAVPGHSLDCLKVSAIGDSLIVSGCHMASSGALWTTLAEGFVAREFHAEFLLQNKFEVQRAVLRDGVLTVWLKKADQRPIVKDFPITEDNQSQRSY